MAKIGRLSHVTERLAGGKTSFGTSGTLHGAQAPREMAEILFNVTGSLYLAGGTNSSNVSQVTSLAE